MAKREELVFLPLGGSGEIGMNCYAYGTGTERKRQWLLVDLGVKFGGEKEPGIDVVLPDIGFITKNRKDLAGLVITHAHEDHYGAVKDLWPPTSPMRHSENFAKIASRPATSWRSASPSVRGCSISTHPQACSPSLVQRVTGEFDGGPASPIGHHAAKPARQRA